MTFKVGDLVKLTNLAASNPEDYINFPYEIVGQVLRVYKTTSSEILVEFDGDTYGFTPNELEITSKLHEQLK